MAFASSFAAGTAFPTSRRAMCTFTRRVSSTSAATSGPALALAHSSALAMAAAALSGTPPSSQHWARASQLRARHRVSGSAVASSASTMRVREGMPNLRAPSLNRGRHTHQWCTLAEYVKNAYRCLFSSCGRRET